MSALEPPTALAALAASVAVGALLPSAVSWAEPPVSGPVRPAPDDWMHRWRPMWCVLAGLAAAVFLGGLAGVVAGIVTAAVTWVVIARAEPAAVRREREAVRHDLPHVVGLLADALRAGRSPSDALVVVLGALPGPAAERLAGVVPRLELGTDPAEVWSGLAVDPVLAPLGRTLSRAHTTGAPVVEAVERLADDLARDARGRVEDRARAVGVKAALPLGLCLLPAFVLIGIVPVVAGLMSGLGWV